MSQKIRTALGATLAMIVAMCLSLPLTAALASAETVPATDKEPSFIRVGGDYKVESVEKRQDGTFLIEFHSTKTTGKFDVLKLESDHVHVAVKVGETLRLSAEIASQKGAVAQVAQVVLFLPNVTGPVPVWLLSNKTPATDLRGSRYLEMHSPLNDYTIM